MLTFVHYTGGESRSLQVVVGPPGVLQFKFKVYSD